MLKGQKQDMQYVGTLRQGGKGDCLGRSQQQCTVLFLYCYVVAIWLLMPTYSIYFRQYVQSFFFLTTIHTRASG